MLYERQARGTYFVCPQARNDGYDLRTVFNWPNTRFNLAVVDEVKDCEDVNRVAVQVGLEEFFVGAEVRTRHCTRGIRTLGEDHCYELCIG